MVSRTEEIVGREDEVVALADLVDEVERKPRHLVLEGEAGIGKTILLRYATDRARTSGVDVLAASPVALETPLAFAGLRDLLDEAFDDVAPDLPVPQRRALDIALLRADPGSSPPDQGAVAAAFLAALRALAARKPALVVVDDIQWLDEPTRFVLGFAARRLREEPVTLLLALRTGSATPEVLRGARPENRLTLGPLSVGALHRIIRTRLGVSPSRPALVRLHELSGGNPFFGLEIARAFERRGGWDSWAAMPLPARLQDFVGERLEALPPETVEVLQVAAATAQPTVTLVAEAAGGAPQALDPAVAADVISTVGERVVFTHPLLAAAAYAGAGPHKRRELHRRLSTLVADPEEQARHLARAATGPDRDVASALERAAERARSRGAPAAAAELAESALRLTPSSDSEDRLRRATTAAGNLFEAGDAAASAALFERAVEAALPGPRRAEALTGLGRAYGYAADLRAAARVFERAISEAEPGSRTEAEAEDGLAVARLRLLDDLAAAERSAAKAVELATRRGDVSAAHEFRASLAVIRALRGETTTAPRGLTPERRDAPRPRFLTTLYGPDFNAAVQAVFADELAGARDGLERAFAQANESGDEASLPLVLRYLSFVELLAGDWARAQALADEGYEAALLTGQRAQQAVLAATNALIAAHRGEPEATRRKAEEALLLVSETGSGFAELLGRSGLGLLALSLGEDEEAAAHLNPLLDKLEAAGVRAPGAMRFVPDLIEARLRLGRLPDATALLATYEERAVALDRPSAVAAAARCRALLAAAETDLDAARVAAERALEHHSRVPMPFERARTLLVRGAVERRAKRKRAAREALDEARAVFDRLGARAFAEQARLELTRIGGRAPAGDALTPSERRVAALVAEGRSTKEVAAALFVSPKTVEGHLSRIYAKLGVRSRTALSRQLSERG
jgi:DNA-binding CsgD family transcriptional regulator